MRRYSTLLTALLGLLLASAVTAQANSMAEKKLPPCPDSPNCVCSLDSNPDRKIEPIHFNSSPEQAWDHLKTILLNMPRTRIVEEGYPGLRVEFRTKVFGFVDDGVFFVDALNGVIHVRSASRTGYWDLGKNRKRLEMIRKTFSEMQRDD